jgi:hypothetical protein
MVERLDPRTAGQGRFLTTVPPFEPEPPLVGTTPADPGLGGMPGTPGG